MNPVELHGVFHATPSRLPLTVLGILCGAAIILVAVALAVLGSSVDQPRIEAEFSLKPGEVGTLGFEISELSAITLAVVPIWESDSAPLEMVLVSPDGDLLNTVELIAPASGTSFVVDRSVLEESSTGWKLIVMNTGTVGLAEGKLTITQQKMK